METGITQPNNMDEKNSVDKSYTKQETKDESMQPYNIPYILNGELYQILSQDAENVQVRCTSCPPERVYRGSVRSTGNFHMHIKRRHPDLLGKLHNMKVSALLERRDRLMKHRKYRRNCRASFTSSLTTVSSAVKNEPDSVSSEDQQQHSLKIKTAFQRHKQERSQEHLIETKSPTQTKLPQSSPIPTSNEIIDEQQQTNLTMQERNAGIEQAAYNNSNDLNDSRILNNLLSLKKEIYLIPSLYLEKPLDLTNNQSQPNPFQDYSRIRTTVSLNGNNSSSNNTNKNINNFNNEAGLQGHQTLDVLLNIESMLHRIHQDVKNIQEIETKRLVLETSKFRQFQNNNFI